MKCEMTNKEFYKDELLDMFIEYNGIGLHRGKLESCRSIDCEDCDWNRQEDFDCDERFHEWLNKEYEPFVCVFTPRIGEDYYWIDNEYEIRYNCFVDDSVDRKFQENGNACTDKVYMEKRAREIKLYNLLSNFAYQVNDGWEPDWNNDCENKWFIWFNYLLDKWEPAYIISMSYSNMVYFKTEELAKRAINEVIIPFESNLI
nr:MAG TPA: hypothetical protein [Caudoviricetes sp.]